MNFAEVFSSSFKENWLTIIEKYQIAGGDINHRHPISGWTLLHTAVECDRLEAIKWLINHGADIDIQDAKGWTPLHRAVDSDIDSAIQQGTEITMINSRLLIELGADKAIKDNSGLTPLDVMKEYGVLPSLLD